MWCGLVCHHTRVSCRPGLCGWRRSSGLLVWFPSPCDSIVIAQAPDSVSNSLKEEEVIAMANRKKCYDELKQMLLRRCSTSENERFTTLLKGASIPSSDRPSDIFRAITSRSH